MKKKDSDWMKIFEGYITVKGWTSRIYKEFSKPNSANNHTIQL